MKTSFNRILFFAGIFFFSCSSNSSDTADNKQPEQTTQPVLCTVNPSTEVVKVFNYFYEIEGKKTLSGATANVSWNINESKWIYQQTNKYPAINSFDYIHLYASPSNWIDYGNTTVVENWWNSNGLVSILWHWTVPKTSGNTSDYAFYATGRGGGSTETDFDAELAIQKGTPENKILMADLNKIADYIEILQKKKIPILWRPLHEASGTWFWWGAKGPKVYKELWKIMFDTFSEKGLDNLIWIWTSEGNDSDWYPGDEYVDIIGRDVYNQKDKSVLASEYDNLKKKYSTKIVILSECGAVAKISDQWNAGARWGCFMPWYDYDRTKNPGDSNFAKSEHIFADKEWWLDAWNQDYVVSRDKLPSFK